MDDRHSDPLEAQGFTPAGRFDSLPEAEEYALVALAMGLECLILKPGAAGPFVLLVPQAQAEAAGREFAAYQASEGPARGQIPAPPAFAPGLKTALLWVLSLLVTFWFQTESPGLTNAWSNASEALFAQGQWWRPFTALFLHADLTHLLGNAVYGLLFFPLVVCCVGPRTGWCLIFASGVAGNLLTAWARFPGGPSSLGASTATFGALGILIGFSLPAAWRSRSCQKLRSILVPAGAGLFLLGWLGSGEDPTDVLGHLCGFLAGTVSGLLAGLGRSRE